MDRRGFCAVVMERALGKCEWPDCHEWGDHAAHIIHAGMGGTRHHDPGNGWFLCRFHHDLFDGRISGFQKPLREITTAYLRLARHT